MSRKSSKEDNPGILEKAKRKISDTAQKAKEVAISAKDAFYGEDDENLEDKRTFHVPIDESMSNEKEEYSHYILDGFKEETEADKDTTMIYNLSISNTDAAQIDKLTIALYSITVIMDIYNLCWVIVCMPLIIMDRKLFHINFRVLRGIIILSYFVFIIGNILFTSSVLIEGTLQPVEYKDIYFIGTLLLAFGTHLLRCLWVAIFIERATATIFSRIYEHGRFWRLSFILPILFCGLAIAIIIGRFISSLNEYVLHGIRFFIDILGCTISENIRVFKLIYPIMIIGVSTTTLGTIIGIIKVIPNILNLFYYIQIIYHQLFLIHITASLILWAKGNRLYSNKLRRFWRKLMHKPISTEPTQVAVVLKNVEGIAINKSETIDDHFKQLKEMWK